MCREEKPMVFSDRVGKTKPEKQKRTSSNADAGLGLPPAKRVSKANERQLLKAGETPRLRW